MCWATNVGEHSPPMTPTQFQTVYPTMSTNQAEAAAKASGNKA